MISRYEDELICDMAEVYHVFDMRALPLKKLAVLACGLSPESRVNRAKNKAKLSLGDTLLCLIADQLGRLVWLQTKDGAKGINRPESILEKLKQDKPENEKFGYASPAEFEAARKRIIGG